MKLAKSRPPTRLGMLVTPLIDIVFLLVIFFMTVSQISRTMDFPIELPVIPHGGEATEAVTLTLNIDIEGQAWVAGRPMSHEELDELFTDAIARADGQPRQVEVLVRCDRRSPSLHVNRLVDRLVHHGIVRMRVSIQEP